MTGKIYLEDPQWAIATQAPIAELERLRAQLPKWLRDDGVRLIEGEAGFAALIALGGG